MPQLKISIDEIRMDSEPYQLFLDSIKADETRRKYKNQLHTFLRLVPSQVYQEFLQKTPENEEPQALARLFVDLAKKDAEIASSNIQSCFNIYGQLTVVNGINPCIANFENNSTNSNTTRITSVQPTYKNGNSVSTFARGQSGYVKVNIYSGYSTPSLVTMNLFYSNLNTLGTSSAKYMLNSVTSHAVLPYYVPTQSETGMASIYANVLTDGPNKGDTSESPELLYFVGLL